MVPGQFVVGARAYVARVFLLTARTHEIIPICKAKCVQFFFLSHGPLVVVVFPVSLSSAFN